MRSLGSLNKFIVASAIIHLGFLGGATLFALKKEKSIPVEISFGTGNSRGGSGPKAAPAPAPQAEANKVAAAPKVKALKTTQTDAPVVAQATSNQETTTKTETATALSTAASGSGLGTTSGSGSGTNSGSGAGFNDPKIRYRGMVHQLVNSMKKYPRKARALQQEGTVVAKIKLSKTGKLLDVEIVESSSYKILAQATLEAIKSVKKFPDIPSEMGLDEITFNVPFEYEITNGDFI